MIATRSAVRPTLMTRLLRLGGFALTALLMAGISVLLWFTQQNAHALITNPYALRGEPGDNPSNYGVGFEPLTLTAEDGAKLGAWYIPSQNGAAVILVHGYKGSRTEMLNEAVMLHKHGYGSILVSLRAHDESDGETITFGRSEVQDVDAAYQYLLTRDDIEPERIGIIGNSMGANVTILYAADNPQLKAVVANSSFASLQDQIPYGVREITGLPPFPFAPMIQFFAEQETGFRAREIAADQRIDEISPRPILIMHGGKDTLVPEWNGERLYNAAGEPKELWYDAELGHTQFDWMRAEEYERRVIALFDAYLLGNQ